MFTLHNTTNTV